MEQLVTAIRALFRKSPELAMLGAIASLAAVGVVVYGVVQFVPSGSNSAPTSATQDTSAVVATPPDTSTLNTETAAAILLAYSFDHCRMDANEIVGNQYIPWTTNWENQLAAKGYTLSSPQPGIDEWTYAYQGTMLKVQINKGSPGDFGVSGCLNVPSSINVLDTTIDPSGKSATVTFRYGPKVHTPFAAELTALVPTPSNDDNADEQSSDWTSEHQAFFQKLDATGWRVDSIR